MKPKLNQHLGESRFSQAPKKGETVFYPVPHPPVSHIEKDGKTHEIAVPVGNEEWFEAKVVDVENYTYSVSPNDCVAIIRTKEGLELSISVVFLQKTKPPKAEKEID